MSLLTVTYAGPNAPAQGQPINLVGTVGLPPNALLEARAKNELGFRAYESLSAKRQVALTNPDQCLQAKRDFIMGTGGNNAPNNAALYGTYAGANPIPGVANEVAELYRTTLRALYEAGADVETAEKYAKQVAQTMADAKLAIVDLQFPDYFSEGAEKELFTARITGANPAQMLGARALSALPSSGGRKPKAITAK